MDEKKLANQVCEYFVRHNWQEVGDIVIAYKDADTIEITVNKFAKLEARKLNDSDYWHIFARTPIDLYYGGNIEGRELTTISRLEPYNSKEQDGNH